MIQGIEFPTQRTNVTSCCVWKTHCTYLLKQRFYIFVHRYKRDQARVTAVFRCLCFKDLRFKLLLKTEEERTSSYNMNDVRFSCLVKRDCFGQLPVFRPAQRTFPGYRSLFVTPVMKMLIKTLPKSRIDWAVDMGFQWFGYYMMDLQWSQHRIQPAFSRKEIVLVNSYDFHSSSCHRRYYEGRAGVFEHGKNQEGNRQ